MFIYFIATEIFLNSKLNILQNISQCSGSTQCPDIELVINGETLLIADQEPQDIKYLNIMKVNYFSVNILMIAFHLAISAITAICTDCLIRKSLAVVYCDTNPD